MPSCLAFFLSYMTCVNDSSAAALCSLHILREIYEGGILYYTYKNAPCQWAHKAACITAKKFCVEKFRKCKEKENCHTDSKKGKTGI